MSNFLPFRRRADWLIANADTVVACLFLFVAAKVAYGQESSPSIPVYQAVSRIMSRQDVTRAEDAYLAGAKALDRRAWTKAETNFERAVQLNPTRTEYAQALARTHETIVAQLVQRSAEAKRTQRPAQADTLLAQARALNPQSELLAKGNMPHQPVQFELRHQVEYAPPIQLLPASNSHAFQERGEVQQVVRTVAEAYGVHVVFDDSVIHSQLRFALDAAPYTQTMPILLHMAHLFAVPLDGQTILVAKDTQENRLRLERQVEETIYVPGSTKEQMTELVNIVKNVFDVKQVSQMDGPGLLLVRCPATTLPVMNATLADLIDGGAEVSMQLKLYEVDKSWTRTTGANLPNQFGGFSIASEAQSLVSANQSVLNQAIASGAITLGTNATTNLINEVAFLLAAGLVNSAQFTGFLGTVGGGLSLLGVYEVGGATFNLGMNSSDVRSIEDVQVRVDDRQTNTLKIGNKYPITTSTYSTGSSSGTASALAGVSINGVSASSLLQQYLGTSGTGTTATTPQVQYEDLGLTLKTTPIVEKSGAVAMHVELKIEALTGTSLSNNPVLSSRALTSDVTVQDGSSAVIVSALTQNEIGSLNGIPGLSELPGFQDATGSTTEKDSTEIVMVLTPHIVRRRREELVSRRMVFHSSVPQDY